MSELPVKCRLHASCETDKRDDDGEYAQEQCNQPEDETPGGVDDWRRRFVTHVADKSDDRIGCLVGPVWISQRITRHEHKG